MSSSKRKRQQSEDDVYVVEKILDKRKNKDLGIEYLIKWENYSMEESTWESEENVSCPDLIAEFERERRKKIAGAAERSSTAERSSAATTAPREDADVDEILGMTEQRIGERMFVLKFTDGTVSMMPVAEVHSRFPTHALRFYEKRVRFVDSA